MDLPVELHNIFRHTASVDKESVREIPEAFKDEEQEYIKMHAGR